MPDFDPENDDSPTFNAAAGVAAWVFPGLGHFIRGEKRRARLIMSGLLFLILSGVLIGGVDCVDRKRDRLWFLAQSLGGPIVFAADFVNQNYVQKLPDEERFKAIALNKPNEMGTLFVALAGLMNLVVMMDAMFSPRRGEFINRRRGNQPIRETPAVAAPLTPSDSGAIT